MRKRWAGLLFICLLGGMAYGAAPRLPQRDLTVELRQVEEGREGGSYSAGSASAPLWEPQMVQVRNGEKAVLRINDSIPMQWTSSVSGPNPSGGAQPQLPGSKAGTGVTQTLAWFDAGQSVSVQAAWPGGNKPATVEIEVQRAAVGQRNGVELPKQTRNTLSTTLTVPLAEWVTVASTGGRAPKAGTYSSEAATQTRRLLQLRVMAP